MVEFAASDTQATLLPGALRSDSLRLPQLTPATVSSGVVKFPAASTMPRRNAAFSRQPTRNFSGVAAPMRASTGSRSSVPLVAVSHFTVGVTAEVLVKLSRPTPCDGKFGRFCATKASFQLASAAAIWPAERAAQLKKDDLLVLAPAFLLTELSAAFRIGFLLYLAFVVIDLVIANVLLAMGLSQVTPTNVAIPFKLLLFIVLDGWPKLIHGLVLTYR